MIGLVLSPQLGTRFAFLGQASCLETQWWTCVAEGESPNGCSFVPENNGTTTVIQCPNVSLRCMVCVMLPFPVA